VGVGLDVALVEQAAERFLGAEVAEVVEHFVPEAGVEQVQYGVFDTADVEVDAARVARVVVALAHPVFFDVGVDDTVCVGGVVVVFAHRVFVCVGGDGVFRAGGGEVGHFVPSRHGPLRHHVQVTGVLARPVAHVERGGLPLRSAVQRRRGGGFGVYRVEGVRR